MGFVNGRHLTTVRVRYAETDRIPEHVFTDTGFHPVKPPKTILERLSKMCQEKVVNEREEP